jgi:acyl-coenzyme A synthetase/AMP-(fatty) acid ligase
VKKFYDYVFHNEYPGIVLSVNNQDYTLQDLHTMVHWYEEILVRHGSLQGKRVAVLVPDIPHYIAIFLAVNKLGGILVPLSCQYREQDLTGILELTQPHVIFAVEDYNGFSFGKLIRNWAARTGCRRRIFFPKTDGVYDGLHEIAGEEVPDETEKIDLIGCTSGSTGTPKGVMHTEDGLLHWCRNLPGVVKLSPGDRLLQTVPPSSLFGIFWLLGGLHYRVQTVCTEAFDVFQLANAFEKYGCNKVSSTPSAFRAVYTFARKIKPDLFNNLELCIIAGEIISPELVSMLSETIDCRLMSIYGLSEQGLIMVTSVDLREGVYWKIISGIGYCLKDATEEGLGEIAFHTPEGRFRGYYRRPDLTAEVLTADGWFMTGDIVEAGTPDRIRIIGRKKDMIKKGAISIASGEVEYYLEQHPKVKQAVVVGNPHPVYGEEIVAFLLPEGELEIGELRQFCLHQVAGYKIPDRFILIDQIPLTQGKADKVALKKLLSN